METRIAIVISNKSTAKKLCKDLVALEFTNYTIFPSIEHITPDLQSQDILIIELKGGNESDLLKLKDNIVHHFNSLIPSLLLTRELIAKKFVDKGLLKNSDYITPSYTLRELRLCLEAAKSQKNVLESQNNWLEENGLMTLFNTLPTGVLISDENGNIINANKVIAKILGYSLEELCSMHIKDLVPAENHIIIEQHINYALQGETVRSEVVNICKNGEIKNFEIVDTKILLPNGKNGLLIVSSDITHLKEVDNALIESEEKYRVLVEKSNDGIVFARDGIIVYGNPRIMEMIGISSNDFIGKPFQNFLHVSEVTSVMERYNRRHEGDGSPEIFESLIQSVNGETIPVELNVNMALYLGKPTTLVFIRDISQRKLTEKNLKESEESYRSVFDNTSEAIYIQDLNGVFLDVNKAALNLYGYSKHEIVGSKPEKLSAPGKNDLVDTEKRIKEAFNGNPQIFEFWGLSKDGRVFPKEIILNRGRYFGKDVVFAMARDISERKNAEAILIESEEKYRTLAEQIPVGIYRTSDEGKIFYANPALANILGFKTVDELLSYNVHDLYLNPDERFDVVNSVRNSNSYVQREVRLIRKDGKVIWIRDNGKATLDNNGKLLFFDGVIENITEQKEASEALRNSEANLRTTLNAIPDILFRINRKGIYLDFYATSIDDVLVSKDKIIGHSICDFLSLDICKEVFVAIEKCLSTGILQTIEYTTQIDGVLNYYEARMVPAGDDEVLSLARNITSRKKAEERINMLAQTIQNILEFVSITDTENNIVYVNPAFLKVYGYKEDEILGKHVSILRPSSVSDEISTKIQESTLHGGWQGELINMRKDGHEFPISLSTALILDENGKPYAFIGVATDITDRKIAEQELIGAKEKAEESDRLKTAFLANMSHEIRSPMNAILGFLRILKDEEKLSENGKQYVDLISSSGVQLISVIEDILDTSKIQANQLRLSMRDFDLNALLTDLYTIFSAQVRTKNKMNTILLPPVLTYQSPFQVFSDDLRIRQIFTNLLSNAVKFTPKGVIEFGYSIFIDDENPQIQFFVKDTGIGMAADKMGLIFERFRQADDSYTRMYGGSGLGLAISKGLVELLGGKIWVESKEGIGSTFFFNLPFKGMLIESKEGLNNDIKVVEKHINRVDGLNWKNKTIFIIEDIEDIQFFLKRILLKTGANLIFADSIKTAKKVYYETPNIDLILLDVRLPDGDGYDLSVEFKAHNPKIPIIAQTAYAMDGEKEKSKSFGCDDFITKPIDPDNLYLKIGLFFKKAK